MIKVRSALPESFLMSREFPYREKMRLGCGDAASSPDLETIQRVTCLIYKFKGTGESFFG